LRPSRLPCRTGQRKDVQFIRADELHEHDNVPPVCIMNMSSLLRFTQKIKSKVAYRKHCSDSLYMYVMQTSKQDRDSRVVFLHIELEHCRIEVDAVAIEECTEMLQYQTMVSAKVLHEIHDNGLWLDRVHGFHAICLRKCAPKNQTQTMTKHRFHLHYMPLGVSRTANQQIITCTANQQIITRVAHRQIIPYLIRISNFFTCTGLSSSPDCPSLLVLYCF